MEMMVIQPVNNDTQSEWVWTRIVRDRVLRNISNKHPPKNQVGDMEFVHLGAVWESFFLES